MAEFDVEDVAPADGFTARLSSGTSLHLIACDGTTGRFFLVGADAPSRPVLYANSEGCVGLVGPSLAVALATLVALPNGYDCQFSPGGGDLGQMRRAHAYLRTGCGKDILNLDETQAFIVDELELDLPADPVLTLWQSVHATDPTQPFVDEGDGGLPWGSLLREWTIERLIRH
ncbi:hypothetical protein GCM10010435_91520 [Winogradskya consettensis]|uniref:Uncharacterized protein n=1 Tax=Winogradskya consettensis TaxID=113560 RepID=A0A919T223_9ACTN|nr:hypothetical protein [Actinoplanes consettensis]GIM81450.1 hypothetical protein Aco04nite_76640 [Actinoplanes consettensis]